MFNLLCFRYRISLSGSGSRRSVWAIVPACLTALMVLCAWAPAYAADATPPSAPAADKIQFPEGTATQSGVCGACHKMMFREVYNGNGTDLDWESMKVQ